MASRAGGVEGWGLISTVHPSLAKHNCPGNGVTRDTGFPRRWGSLIRDGAHPRVLGMMTYFFGGVCEGMGFKERMRVLGIVGRILRSYL